jgi:hypothetical protein
MLITKLRAGRPFRKSSDENVMVKAKGTVSPANARKGE